MNDQLLVAGRIGSHQIGSDQNRSLQIGSYRIGSDRIGSWWIAPRAPQVRRDSCPAVAKLLERSIRIVAASRDLSRLKAYLQRQLRKFLEGRLSLKDFVFSKEARRQIA